MRFFLPALPLLCAMLVGCSVPTRTYDVSVKNEMTQPITVWVTKSGPPVERRWLSPEQLATYVNPPGDPIYGRAVPPGKTAHAGPLVGHFPEGTEAILRVYLGQHDLNELLAMGVRNPNRVDVTLPEGRSAYVVHEENGKLRVDPATKSF